MSQSVPQSAPSPLKPVVLGIAGFSGSGKTTLARELARAFNGIHFPLDNYYLDLAHLPPAERVLQNFDDPALIVALKANCFYIGALGSRKTHARRIERMRAQGFDEAALARIHAPIGLDIGAVSPAEIAVSIIGEIVASLRKKPLRSESAAA